MSLDGILQAIEAAGTAEARRIEADTAVQVVQILAEAETAAAQRRATARAAALAPLEAERTRRLRQARSQAAQIVTAAREQLLETALAQTRDRLAALRAAPAYPALLRRLVHQAAAALLTEDGPLEILGDPRDAALLRPLVAELEPLQSAIEPPPVAALTLESWGGVVVRSIDGRLEADNRLESRYARAEPRLRRDLAERFANG
jgi:vacuolar-type H+-ATPase subunit E/Vma4